MIRRIRDRATFDALGRARPHRGGTVWIRSVPGTDPAAPPGVAYAVGRQAGNAVLRNRIRRRLRSAVAMSAAAFAPGAAYLIGAGPEALGVAFPELCATVRDLAHAATPDPERRR